MFRLKFWRFASDTKASSTVEFVLIAPFLFGVFFSMFELGWLMTRSMMLERGLDIAVREARLTTDRTVTQTELKDNICRASKIIVKCRQNLLVELIPIQAAADFPSTTAPCVDRVSNTIPANTFNPNNQTEISFVRACVVIDPLLPNYAFGRILEKDASGGIRLVVVSAFLSEI